MAAGPIEAGADLWSRIDAAAFGIVYGAIIVLSLLMAMGDHPASAVKAAVVLFGSVLAITLAKAFAEFMGHALATGQRLDWQGRRAAWRHSAPTLAVANAPTLLFLLAAVGLVTVEAAVALSQVFCIALLAALGARTGWRVDATAPAALLGGLFAGGVGLALALLKFAIH